MHSWGKRLPRPPSRDTTLCRLCWCCWDSSRCVWSSLGQTQFLTHSVGASSLVVSCAPCSERGQGEARAGGSWSPPSAGTRGATGIFPQRERGCVAGFHVPVRAETESASKRHAGTEYTACPSFLRSSRYLHAPSFLLCSPRVVACRRWIGLVLFRTCSYSMVQFVKFRDFFKGNSDIKWL